KVGIHGSWNSYKNLGIFRKELKRLKHYEVKEGRQHYLRFENPTTWEIWNEMELERDSTLGFYGFNGFRCGVCYNYPVFHIIKREELKLIEEPLIFMENSLLTRNLGFEETSQE